MDDWNKEDCVINNKIRIHVLPEHRMSRWTIGIKRIDQIRNVEIRTRAGMANISENRWLEHVERKTEEDVVMRTRKMEVCGPRNIGKGKSSFYKAQYPVRWTVQSALHFLPLLADLFIPTPTRLLREAF